MIAETEQVEFQALAFDHLFARDVVDYDPCEIGLPVLGHSEVNSDR